MTEQNETSEQERGTLHVITTVDHYDNEVSILAISSKPLHEIKAIIDSAFAKYKYEWDDRWGDSGWIDHGDISERQTKCDKQGYNHLYRIIAFTLDNFTLLDLV